MTQEDKELLLKDLCARLPYGVKVQRLETNKYNFYKLEAIDAVNNQTGITSQSPYMGSGAFTTKCAEIEKIKPYLFPLSSMTEEQKKEYNYWKHEVPVCRYEYGDVVEEIELYDSPESFEYLIENHFDYRGLIEKGLAIDATGLNIY